jgi:predicted regulator of Ras-like GTPase activity (Roadblock/LC7/MglB family)
MKNKMFGFLKNLLPRRPAERSAAPEDFAAGEAFPGYPPSRAAGHGAESARNGHASQMSPSQHGAGVELSLQRVLADLPLELQPRVVYPEVGEMTISVPLEKVLAQLPRGAVKISFGDLRQAAPAVFSPEDDRDQLLVPLPLAEILARLNPALITRRRTQRRVEVPDEISSPFDAHGHGLVFSSGPARAETSAAPRHNTPAPPAHLPPARSGISFSPAPPASASLPPAAAPASARFVTPLQAAPKPFDVARPGRKPFGPPQAAPNSFAAPSCPIPPVSPQPAMSSPAASGPAPAARPARHPNGASAHPVAALAAAPQPTPPESVLEPLLVNLTALAEDWPEVLRKEIVELNMVDAKVALPQDAVEQALKLGRIAFSWKTLRSWLTPAVEQAVSHHDSTVLELPLKVVAPLFLARQREAGRVQQRVTVDDEIPNLFFGAPRNEAPNPAVATPAPAPDTNYYVWKDSSESLQQSGAPQRHPSAGTKFLSKYATPNEIVSRAAALDGVVGALIALPDGLMVANQLPSEFNGDTLAAFLPQIFGKVSQCTRELRLGELNNLNFTVGNVPWKIFRVNAIFFAAFGRPGQPLPTGQLAALAAELDHKPK